MIWWNGDMVGWFEYVNLVWWLFGAMILIGCCQNKLFPPWQVPGDVSRDILLLRGTLGTQIFTGYVLVWGGTFVLMTIHIWLICMQNYAYAMVCFSKYVLVRPGRLSQHVPGETSSMWHHNMKKDKYSISIFLVSFSSILTITHVMNSPNGLTNASTHLFKITTCK